MRPGEDFVGITTPFYCHDGRGRIVMQKRSKEARDEHGRWDPGSGQLEKGLTLQENVRKEVREEYGCDCRIQGSLPPHGIFREKRGERTHWLAIPFFVKVDPSEVENAEPEKFDEIGWFRIDDLPDNLHKGFSQTLEDHGEEIRDRISDDDLSSDQIRTVFDDLKELKHTGRKGWKKRDIEPPVDTIASHSFGAAIIGWLLAESQGLNSDKVVKMLVAHDLMMSRLPDLTPEDEGYGKKRELEKNAVEEMRDEYPELAGEIFDLILEVQEQETEEAEIAKKADKLDTLMQSYSYDDKVEEALLEEFTDGFRRYFGDETAADDLFDDLEDETHP